MRMETAVSSTALTVVRLRVQVKLDGDPNDRSHHLRFCFRLVSPDKSITLQAHCGRAHRRMHIPAYPCISMGACVCCARVDQGVACHTSYLAHGASGSMPSS